MFQQTETSRVSGRRDRESEAQFAVLKREIHGRLIAGMDLSAVGTLDEYELRREIRRGAAELCGYRADLMSLADRERMVDEIIDETLGLGPLEPLLRDATVSDILINGPKTVYIE